MFSPVTMSGIGVFLQIDQVQGCDRDHAAKPEQDTHYCPTVLAERRNLQDNVLPESHNSHESEEAGLDNSVL